MGPNKLKQKLLFETSCACCSCELSRGTTLVERGRNLTSGVSMKPTDLSLPFPPAPSPLNLISQPKLVCHAHFCNKLEIHRHFHSVTKLSLITYCACCDLTVLYAKEVV